jgi:hypothetical protein
MDAWSIDDMVSHVERGGTIVIDGEPFGPDSLPLLRDAASFTRALNERMCALDQHILGGLSGR